MAAGALLALASVGAVACSSGPDTSKGGKTTCASFREMSQSNQEKVVAAMSRAHGDDTPVGIGRLSVVAFCAIYPDRTVDGVYAG